MAREFLNNSDIIWVYLASETLINFMILKIWNYSKAESPKTPQT